MLFLGFLLLVLNYVQELAAFRIRQFLALVVSRQQAVACPFLCASPVRVPAVLVNLGSVCWLSTRCHCFAWNPLFQRILAARSVRLAGYGDTFSPGTGIVRTVTSLDRVFLHLVFACHAQPYQGSFLVEFSFVATCVHLSNFCWLSDSLSRGIVSFPWMNVVREPKLFATLCAVLRCGRGNVRFAITDLRFTSRQCFPAKCLPSRAFSRGRSNEPEADFSILSQLVKLFAWWSFASTALSDGSFPVRSDTGARLSGQPWRS